MSEYQQAQEARRLEAEKNVVCTECGRCFIRRYATSNVLLKRRKSVSEQADDVQCESCERWFRSR